MGLQESNLTEGLSMHAVDFMAEQKIRKRRKSRGTFFFFPPMHSLEKFVPTFPVPVGS